MRVVSWRWSRLIFDSSLLRTINIRTAICEDDKLQALFTASRRVTEVNSFACHFLNGSCILNAGLTRLRIMNLTETAVTDLTLANILQETKKLTELYLAGTRISDKSLSHIIALPKLIHISVPPENGQGFSRSLALPIMGNCATLRTLDCQERYSC